MTTLQEADIPFIPPNVPRSTKKEGTIAMMPFQHNGRSLFLSVQLERDEDEGLIIRLDLQENGGSSEPDDVSCDTIDEVMQRYRPAQRGHFCALRLNPDRILATSRDTRPAMPVVPPEDL